MGIKKEKKGSKCLQSIKMSTDAVENYLSSVRGDVKELKKQHPAVVEKVEMLATAVLTTSSTEFVVGSVEQMNLRKAFRAAIATGKLTFVAFPILDTLKNGVLLKTSLVDRPSWQFAIVAGVVGEVVMGLIFVPWDKINKVRKEYDCCIHDAIRDIIEDEGISGLYSNYVKSVTDRLPFTIAASVSNDLSGKVMSKLGYVDPMKTPYHVHFLAGAGAASASIALAYPLEAAKSLVTGQDAPNHLAKIKAVPMRAGVKRISYLCSRSAIEKIMQ